MNLKYNDSADISSLYESSCKISAAICPNNMYQARFKISGRVQGVFYRAHARDEALQLNLKGYIQNLPDGSVEAVLQNPEKEPLLKFKSWAHQGSPSSEVHDVEITFQPPEEPYFTNMEIY